MSLCSVPAPAGGTLLRAVVRGMLRTIGADSVDMETPIVLAVGWSSCDGSQPPGMRLRAH